MKKSLLKTYETFMNSFFHYNKVFGEDNVYTINPEMIEKGRIIDQLKDCDGYLRADSKGLTSLENMPKRIYGDLNLSNNLIEKVDFLIDCDGDNIIFKNNLYTSLENFPKSTNQNIYVSDSVNTLKGSLKICKYLNLSGSKITSLEFCPIVEKLDISHCECLTNLKYLNDIKLKTLNIRGCKNLTSLFNSPLKCLVKASGLSKDLDYELEFIRSKHYTIKEKYFEQLLDFLIFKKYDINKVEWPEGFLNKNVSKSISNVNKYNL